MPDKLVKQWVISIIPIASYAVPAEGLSVVKLSTTFMAGFTVKRITWYVNVDDGNNSY